MVARKIVNDDDYGPITSSRIAAARSKKAAVRGGKKNNGREK